MYLLILVSGLGYISGCTKDKNTPPEITTTISFSQDIYPVFKSAAGHCNNSGCHTDEFSLPWVYRMDSCFLSLRRDTSVNLLGGVRYINLEHPEESYLYQKLTQDAPLYGQRMPKDGPYLSPEFTAKVLAWIKQGAPNN